MLLSVFTSAVNCKLVCMELKSWRIACMLVWLESYVIRMSSRIVSTRPRLLKFMGPCIVIMFKYISNKTQRYTVYLSGNCSACLGWYLHPSSGAQTTVSTASGICQTVTSTCRYSSR
jgi:hypothetical protein